MKKSKHVAYHRYYQRWIVIRIISEGHNIAKSAKIIEIISNSSYMNKTCKYEGLEGLKLSFGGERPSKLTYEMIELNKCI